MAENSERGDADYLVQCQYCHAEPMSEASLGVHQKHKHGVSTTKPASIRRRRAREIARGLDPDARAPGAARPPPPMIEGVPVYRPLRQKRALLPEDRNRLRQWILHAIHTQYAPQLDIAPELIVEEIRRMCDQNFAAPPSLTRRIDGADLDSSALALESMPR